MQSVVSLIGSLAEIDFLDLLFLLVFNVMLSFVCYETVPADYFTLPFQFGLSVQFNWSIKTSFFYVSLQF